MIIFTTFTTEEEHGYRKVSNISLESILKALIISTTDYNDIEGDLIMSDEDISYNGIKNKQVCPDYINIDDIENTITNQLF